MKYPSGKTVVLGDLVWWNEGTRKGRVAQIVSSKLQQKSWGLDEEGVFLCINEEAEELTCDLFQPLAGFEEEGIDLVC